MDVQQTAEPPAADEPGWEWMAVEVMGHRRHVGRVREEERFGAKLLRIDIPIKGDPAANGWDTRFYASSALFSIRLVDREAALEANRPYTPPARLSLPRPGDEVVDAEGSDEDRIPF